MKLPHEQDVVGKSFFVLFSITVWPISLYLKEQVKVDRKNGYSALIGLTYYIPACLGAMITPICFAYVLQMTPIDVVGLIMAGTIPGYMFFGGVRKLQTMQYHQGFIDLLLQGTPLQSLVLPIYWLDVLMDLTAVCMVLITEDYLRGVLLTMVSLIVAGYHAFVTTNPAFFPAELEGNAYYEAYRGEGFLLTGLAALIASAWSFLVSDASSITSSSTPVS